MGLSWFLVFGTDIIAENMEVGMWALWSHSMCGQEVPSNEGFCSAYVLFRIQSWYVSLLWLGLSGVLLEAFQELYPLEDSTPYQVIKTGYPRMNDQSHIKKINGIFRWNKFWWEDYLHISVMRYFKRFLNDESLISKFNESSNKS